MGPPHARAAPLALFDPIVSPKLVESIVASVDTAASDELGTRLLLILKFCASLSENELSEVDSNLICTAR